MNKRYLTALLAACFALYTQTAGRAETTQAPAHCHGAGTAQELVPPMQVEMYLDGYHNYKKQSHLPAEKQTQVRVAHYCHHISPDLFQCLVYNGNGKDAKLVGVEYVVPETVYNKLPENEKKYWHPHQGEVESGLLRLPGMQKEKEKEILGVLSHTYGKTWNLWQPGDEIPYGEPELMWPIGNDQINENTKKSLSARQANHQF